MRARPSRTEPPPKGTPLRRSSKLLALSAAVSALALGVALAPQRAVAAPPSASASFTVTANVAKVCTVAAAAVSVTYDPFSGAALTFSNPVNVTCTRDTTFSTSLSSTNGWVLKGTATPTNTIAYAVTQTNAAGADWKTTPFAGTAATKNQPVSQVAFFTIAAGLDAPADSYVDTITATVNY